MKRLAGAVLDALEAQGDGELDESWGDAVAWDRSGAAEAVAEANAARALSRARRRRRPF